MLKNSHISMGEDLPKHMQGRWKKVPVSVMRKIKQVNAKPQSSRRRGQVSRQWENFFSLRKI